MKLIKWRVENEDGRASSDEIQNDDWLIIWHNDEYYF